MPKPLESYTAEEREILQFVASKHGREYAEQHAPRILSEAWRIGELPGSDYSEEAAFFERSLIMQRKRKKPQDQ
jgi:hypothetical protein